MLKRMLATALLACTIPAMASAATSWQLTTQATSSGGSITSRNMAAQTSGSGAVFRSYTTQANIGYTVSPATGYSVSKITVNGTVYTNGTGAPAVVHGPTAQTVTAAFAATVLSVTANAGVGGTVTPTNVANMYYGTKLTSPLVFTFTPASGYNVAGITGNGAGVISPALPVAAGVNVKVTFPTGTVITAPIALAGTFASVNPIANAGATQTVMPGTVTLHGTVGATPATTWTWTQLSGPSVGVIPAVQNPSFSATTLGTYVFKLTVNGGSNATTTVFVTNSAASAARNQCVTCHTTYGVGAGVFNNWSASVHEPAAVMCYNCHAGANAGGHPGVAVTSCATCHGAPHSAQIASCTACHTTAGDFHTAQHAIEDAEVAALHVGGAPTMATGGGAQDNAAAGWAAAQPQYLAQGAICADCHSWSPANTAVLAGFAEGGHGKPSADVMNAWTHYNWKVRQNAYNPAFIWGTRSPSNCNRCHTAYGFMKFANQTTGYSRLQLVVGAQNDSKTANNVLMCVGCHSDVNGPLRTDATPSGSNVAGTGAGLPLTSGYFALFSSSVANLGAGNTKAQVYIPGYKNSSICVPCHAGRTNEVYVKNNIGKIANYSTLQLANYQHAANMAQTFAGKGGWDFSGKLKNYSSAANQTPHSALGMEAGNEQGPCVVCHYSTAGKTHSLEVHYTSNACTPCHGASGPNLAKFEEFSSARFALDTLVRSKMAPLLASGSADLNVERGGYFRYGRFGKAPGAPADRTTAQNAYGAVYNWQLLKTWDPNAWAHNPAYARQILVDTLAFLNSDGAVLTGDQATTLAAINAANAINAVNTTEALAFANGNKSSKGLCIGCHAVAQNAGPGFVQDNNGVRAITTEFTKWSHHVTGTTLQDAHCAACHLEGKAENGKIVVDPTKHLADAFTHLRNADDDNVDMVWNPNSPNHTTMDNFCNSCHDALGATSAGSLAIQAIIVPAAGQTASPLNPFGDTISNRYDKMARGRVVDVDGQFATGNYSHHAVKGKKYSGSERGDGVAARTVDSAAFSANSSAALPGERRTLREAGVLKTFAAGELRTVKTGNPSVDDAATTAVLATFNLNTMYETLTPAAGSDATLGDDSPLHCADCHTVGQYAAKGSVAYNNAKAAYAGYTTYNRVAIGAHGSNNEYMLRNTKGTDELHVAANFNLTALAASGNDYKFSNPGSPFLVCYNCHAFQTYGSVLGLHGHAGEYAKGNRCNGENNTFAGYTTGTLTNFANVSNFNKGRLYNASIGNGSSGNGGGNIFAIQCANCHNSGPENKFGGIHGSRIQTYQDANNVQQPARRFLSGLGDWKHVPMGSVNTVTNTVGVPADTGWEMEMAGTGEGCYTLSSKTTASVSVASSQNESGQTMFGTWGACADHGGNPAAGTNVNTGTPNAFVSGGDQFERSIIRPVRY
jgi:hypothetical protein